MSVCSFCTQELTQLQLQMWHFHVKNIHYFIISLAAICVKETRRTSLQESSSLTLSQPDVKVQKQSTCLLPKYCVGARISFITWKNSGLIVCVNQCGNSGFVTKTNPYLDIFCCSIMCSVTDTFVK